MWSTIKIKTKINKRRVELKVSKKKHNLIRCKCQECGKKKWSQYNKKSNKTIALVIINLIAWTVAIDGITNWYGERGVWTLTQAAEVREETESVGTAQSNPNGSGVDGIMAVANDSSLAETVGGIHVPSVSGSAIEDKIRKAFPGEEKIALAVAKSESGLDPNAKGYNCKYGERSTSCKPEDRHKAWSVDCGIFQVNIVSQECPEHLMDPESNIAIAKEMQSKRGWNPWVGFWNGQYKNHL